MIYDISPTLSTALAVWPTDTPLTREINLDQERGDQVTLSTLRATVHLGAHADAPSHYGRRAPSIAECALERFLGPCEVIHVARPRDGRVPADALPDALQAERVLIATGTYPDPTRFCEDFAGLAPDLIAGLRARGVTLVGIDTPSVDPFHADELRAHRACLAHDVLILEGLVLAHVPAGVYELIALPLKLADFEASPVRAILRTIA